LGEQGREEPQADTDVCKGIFFKCFNVKSIEHLQVLTKDRVDEEIALDFLHQLSFIASPVEVEEHHWDASHEERHDEEEHEADNRSDRLNDQADEERCLFEETEPVECFDHQE